MPFLCWLRFVFDVIIVLKDESPLHLQIFNGGLQVLCQNGLVFGTIRGSFYLDYWPNPRGREAALYNDACTPMLHRGCGAVWLMGSFIFVPKLSFRNYGLKYHFWSDHKTCCHIVLAKFRQTSFVVVVSNGFCLASSPDIRRIQHIIVTCSSFSVTVSLLAASLIRFYLFFILFYSFFFFFIVVAHYLHLLMIAFTQYSMAHLMFWKYLYILLLISNSSQWDPSFFLSPLQAMASKISCNQEDAKKTALLIGVCRLFYANCLRD